MIPSIGDSSFISFQRESLDKSPQDIRAYWTPERKKAAVPRVQVPLGSERVGCV